MRVAVARRVRVRERRLARATPPGVDLPAGFLRCVPCAARVRLRGARRLRRRAPRRLRRFLASPLFAVCCQPAPLSADAVHIPVALADPQDEYGRVASRPGYPAEPAARSRPFGRVSLAPPFAALSPRSAWPGGSRCSPPPAGSPLPRAAPPRRFLLRRVLLARALRATRVAGFASLALAGCAVLGLRLGAVLPGGCVPARQLDSPAFAFANAVLRAVAPRPARSRATAAVLRFRFRNRSPRRSVPWVGSSLRPPAARLSHPTHLRCKERGIPTRR